jgi:hypothetical protein
MLQDQEVLVLSDDAGHVYLSLIEGMQTGIAEHIRVRLMVIQIF